MQAQYDKLRWLVSQQPSVREQPVWETEENVAAGDMDDGTKFVGVGTRVLGIDSEGVSQSPPHN